MARNTKVQSDGQDIVVSSKKEAPSASSSPHRLQSVGETSPYSTSRTDVSRLG